MYNLRGTVTAAGTVASTIAGTGANAGYHLAGNTTFNVADAVAGPDLTVSGSLVNQDATHGSAAGGLTKTGPGTMILSGGNAYAGTTAVAAGQLAFTTAASTVGPVTVADAASLRVAPTLAGTTPLTSASLTTTAVIVHSHAFTVGPNGGTITVATAGQFYFPGTDQLLGTGPLTLNGGGTLVAGAGNLRLGSPNGYAGPMTIQQGGILEYGTGGAIAGGATVTLANQSELAVQGGGATTVPNALTVTGGTNTVLSFENGTAGGAWTGNGLTSTTAAANPNRLTAVGVIANQTSSGSALYATVDGRPVTTADVLARFTYYGDDNLDGRIDAADYTRLDAGFLTRLSGWGNGDFNYDGTVDASDYTLADNAFNRQTGGLTAPAALLARPAAAVPEPASPAVVAATAAALRGRRYRRRSIPA